MRFRNLVFALSIIALAGTLTSTAPSVSAATLTVTTAADSGSGSLREAITFANLTHESDTIEFNIEGQPGTTRTITLLTELPDITAPLRIDGYTQPGATLK